MNMTQAEQALFSLIRKSLFHSEEEFPSELDWNAVLLEAKAQAVIGIAAKALPADVPSSVRREWELLSLSQLAGTVRYWKAQDDLHQLLTENGISYVILKGASAAMLYPDPFSRAMGDIDFLVPPEQFEQAKALLESSGFQHCHKDSERHIAFIKDNISYELHRRFRYLDLDMEDMLQAAIPCAEHHQVAGHEFCTLPAKENGLVLLGHLWNHLHTGVGLRQVLDWMMYVQAFVTDSFWDSRFSSLAKQYRLETTAIVAAQVCQKHFHMPISISWCDGADETLCDELMETVMEYGNFGSKQPIPVKSEAKARASLSGLHRYGFFRYLQYRGKVNWTAYHKHPRLKPFAWLYQLLRYAFLWLSSSKEHKFTALTKKSRETSALLKRLRPSSRPEE